MKLKLCFLAAVALAVQAVAGPPQRIVLPPDEVNPSKVFQTVAADEGPDWGVAALKAPEAWKATKGKGVKVAVLDTGASLTHPDLKAAYKDAKDFTGSRSGTKDVQGHGTHCAGSIGGRGPLPGVAPECDLFAAKVLDDSGSGGVDEIAAGIRHAAKVWEVDVISMSLGGPSADTWIPPALKEADELGVIVICAAGNDGPRENSEGYPGRYPQSISVAASNKAGQIANFSSRGPNVFITGPGVDIRSTYPGGQYATMSGTSMATPHIAGVAALWIAAHPEVPKKDRPKAFREALKASTKYQDRNSARGYGLPDAVKVVGTSGPILPPPAVGSVTVGWADLSELKRAELTKAGISVFELKVGGSLTPPPAPAPAVEQPKDIGPAKLKAAAGNVAPVYPSKGGLNGPEWTDTADNLLYFAGAPNLGLGNLRVDNGYVVSSRKLRDGGGNLAGLHVAIWAIRPGFVRVYQTDDDGRPLAGAQLIRWNPSRTAGATPSPGADYELKQWPGVGLAWVHKDCVPTGPTTVCPEAYPPSALPPATVPQTMPSTCPGGVCPPQPARSLRGIGNWFQR